MPSSGSAKSIWSDYAKPEPVDPRAFLYCGADPVWTPEREYRVYVSDDAAAGRCSLCGDGADLDDGSGRRVCARCMTRAGEEIPPAPGTIEAYNRRVIEAGKPVADEPGYVAKYDACGNKIVVPERFAAALKG